VIKTKNKKRDIKGSTTLSPFGFELVVIITNDMERITKKHNITSLDHNTTAGFFASNGLSGMIVLDINHISYGLISHEACHCVFATLARAGQDVKDGEETFAYLLQRVVEFCIDICTKNKIKLH
jgi:hypothetical protein